MNYFLIDYENIGFTWTGQDVGFQEGDTLVVFYSDHRKNLNLDELNDILKLKPIIQLQKISTGTKNALDFQLTSYLGYLIGTHLRNSNFHILSNDKGFDAVCHYWRKEQYFVDRIGNGEKQETKGEEKKEKGVNLEDKIRAYLGTSPNVKIIAHYVKSSRSKTELNNSLSKYFHDGKKVAKILKTIKPVLESVGLE